jgi:hypothetical protein
MVEGQVYDARVSFSQASLLEWIRLRMIVPELAFHHCYPMPCWQVMSVHDWGAVLLLPNNTRHILHISEVSNNKVRLQRPPAAAGVLGRGCFDKRSSQSSGVRVPT